MAAKDDIHVLREEVLDLMDRFGNRAVSITFHLDKETAEVVRLAHRQVVQAAELLGLAEKMAARWSVPIEREGDVERVTETSAEAPRTSNM